MVGMNFLKWFNSLSSEEMSGHYMKFLLKRWDRHMKSKFWNYVLYNYFRKIKSKSFIGFNIFLILVGLLISQLGSIVNFFNETYK